MAKWIMGEGLNGYVAYLQKLNLVSDKIIGKAVYEMAKVVADRVRENIESLPAQPKGQITFREGNRVYSRLSQEEKEGLLEGFGISPMEKENGYINVKLGFDGYNEVKTKKYPQGQPNVLIARVTESGSTYRKKTPFVRPAVNATKQKAIEAGRVTIDETIQSISSE